MEDAVIKKHTGGDDQKSSHTKTQVTIVPTKFHILFLSLHNFVKCFYYIILSEHCLNSFSFFCIHFPAFVAGNTKKSYNDKRTTEERKNYDFTAGFKCNAKSGR